MAEFSNPITEVNGYSIKPGWYETMRVASEEQNRAYLHSKWQTDKQRAFNAAHKACPRCHGRGQIRRDINTGCKVCLGRGVLPND